MNHTLVVAAGVIWRDARVLLTKRRKGDTLGGMWEFPGGKLRKGESPKEAVARECHEECAIVIQPVDILDVAYHRYPTRDILLLFYDCRWQSGGSEASGGGRSPVGASAGRNQVRVASGRCRRRSQNSNPRRSVVCRFLAQQTTVLLTHARRFVAPSSVRWRPMRSLGLRRHLL